jgi:1-acyl-sn-glycerol-3-phosphate acyltransferase
MAKSRKERVHKIQKLWSHLLLRVGGVKVKVEGTEYVQPYGSYMIMANHQSYFDIFILLTIPLFIHWMAKEELFKIPLFGTMLRSLGGISIDRGQRARGFSSIKKASRTIRRGSTVLIFPEGTRSSSGELLPFNEGGFFLAILSRAVVLPIIIKGTYKVMPKGSFRVSPGAVHVIIKAPIETKGFSLKERSKLKEKVRSVFQEDLQGTEASKG